MATTTELSGAACAGLIDRGVAEADDPASPVDVGPYGLARSGPPGPAAPRPPA